MIKLPETLKNFDANNSQYSNYLMQMHNKGAKKYCNLIQKLTQPLSKHFNIIGFRSIAYSYSGEFFFYGSRPKMAEDFIKGKLYLYYQDIPWPKYDALILPLAKLNANLPKLQVEMDAAKWLPDEDVALCLCENTQYGREQFWFSGHTKDGVKEIFHNERGALREFIHYFIQESTPLREELMQMHYSVYDYHYYSNNNIILKNHCIEESNEPFVRSNNDRKASFLHDIGVFNQLAAKQNLSYREQQVLQLTSQGKTAKEIAEILFLSNKTVEFHLQKAKEKLNARNKLELVSTFSILKHIGFEWISKKTEYLKIR
ncbi:helix-turn-helix transcriptional regulator [Thiotrichales bacterium 19X7-9]|nr:helix-turn-helix transcriptional regulator [Thiotrichales bacterium 19X7-9]